MRLLLFTGFLGSGKTTLVLKFAQHAIDRQQKVAILVNEIGEVGIDNQLMKRLDFNVWELLNGCICCTLSADMVSTLQQLDSDYSPDIVILEPSGAADPRSIHKALPYYKGTPLQDIRTISVLDPLRAEMLMEVMTPLITAQIKNADLLLISKTDVAQPEEIEKASGYAARNNPGVKVIPIDLDTPIETLVKEIAPWMN